MEGGSNLIPKRTKDTDISNDILQGKHFKKKLLALGLEVGRAYANDTSGKTLSEYIADVAKKEGFNRIQIQRLVEEGNTQAYLAKYAKMRDLKQRDVEFPLASQAEVVRLLGADAPPEVENPNIVQGLKGSGEMKKEASTQEAVYQSFNDGVSKSREKMAARRAREREQEKTASLGRLNRERESQMFKIAHSLVRTEQFHKNANEVFNTMLASHALSEESVDGILKKASSISELLHKKGHLHKNRMVDLKVNEQEKVASHLLGSLSLIDTQQASHVKDIPFSGYQNIESFNDLLKVASTLERYDQDVVRINQD